MISAMQESVSASTVISLLTVVVARRDSRFMHILGALFFKHSLRLGFICFLMDE